MNILDVFSGVDYKTPPIWLMRQAGRYLPEYRALRHDLGGFLDLCYNPEKAKEVTIQPIKRFGFDAAIVFSDILVIPDSMGIGLEFKQGVGPVLQTVRNQKELEQLQERGGILESTYDTLRKVKNEIPHTPLIGFAGAPWTVCTYILEGRGKTGLKLSKQYAENNQEYLDLLVEKIKIKTIEYLKKQIEAGADLIKIFDSWAGILEENEFNRYVIAPTRDIVSEIKKEYPKVKIMGFPKGANDKLDEYIKKTKIDAITVDYNLSLQKMKKLSEQVVVQGNLDPDILKGDKKELEIKVKTILDSMQKAGKYRNYIFNLGHGILPETPIENVELMLDIVRKNNG